MSKVTRPKQKTTDARTRRINANFEKQVRVFRRLLGRPDDSPEQVHRIRVTARKLMVALWIVKSETNSRRLRRAYRSVRKIHHALGPQRELDVALESAVEFDLPRNRLTKARARSASRTLHYLKSHRKDVLRELDAANAWLVRHHDISVEGALSKLRRNSQVQQDPHRLRIYLKKVRYTLQALDYDVGPLVKIQQQLGRVHDLEVLLELNDGDAIIRKKLEAAADEARRSRPPALRFAKASLLRAATSEQTLFN